MNIIWLEVQYVLVALSRRLIHAIEGAASHAYLILLSSGHFGLDLFDSFH